MSFNKLTMSQSRDGGARKSLELGPTYEPTNFDSFVNSKRVIPIDDIAARQEFFMDNKELESSIDIALALRDTRSYDEKLLAPESEVKSEYMRFQELPENQRESIERALVYTAIKNPAAHVKLLRYTGLTQHPAEIAALERKYQTPMPYAWVALPLYEFTYALWNSRHVNIHEKDGRERIEACLEQALKAASLLQKCNTTLTHATSDYAAGGIRQNEEIRASDTSLGSHYEGDGVYTGVLGGYRDWNDFDEHFVMRGMSLADALPIITAYNNPQAMANILAQGVWANQDMETAVVDRPLQWRDCNLPTTIEPERITLLSRFLRVPVHVIVDDDGCDCLVAETKAPPIVWGSLCRALRIRRFIPMSEVGGFAPDVWQRAEESVRADAGSRRVDVVKKYQDLDAIEDTYGDTHIYIQAMRGVATRRK